MHIPSQNGEQRQGPKLRRLFGSKIQNDNDRAEEIPAHHRGIRVTKPVQLLDLFPTLVHKTGLPRLKKCNKEKASITNYPSIYVNFCQPDDFEKQYPISVLK